MIYMVLCYKAISVLIMYMFQHSATAVVSSLAMAVARLLVMRQSSLVDERYTGTFRQWCWLVLRMCLSFMRFRYHYESVRTILRVFVSFIAIGVNAATVACTITASSPCTTRQFVSD